MSLKIKLKQFFCHLKALKDHLNQCLDYPINAINKETTVKLLFVPPAKCFLEELMLKLLEVSFNLQYHESKTSCHSKPIH